ncbi:MAG: integrase core domain-containing protein [Pseudobdellovibrionaceae bacterium]
MSVHFIDPGKPAQNGYIESFNGKFRKEFLSLHKYNSIESLRQQLRKWIEYYNEQRPHSSLDYMTPKEFAQQQQNMIGH